MLKLVLFDMDGVIFEGKNFWLELHKLMGTEKQAWQLWTGLGSRDYERLSWLTAKKLWQGRSAELFLQLVAAREPVRGIEGVFAYLGESGIRSAIVSSGPYQLAQRARELFSIDEIRANRLEIDGNGRFTGSVDVQVDDNFKGVPARRLMAKFGADPDSTAMIGDAASDIAMSELASLSIAYDSNDSALLRACKHHVAGGEMSAVVDLLRAQATLPGR
jgi:HAD superfamily phosphoserine phosphatase-like hydrolase